MTLLDDREGAITCTRQALDVAEKVRFRPDVALAHLQLSELLTVAPDAASVAELESMRMQPALDRAHALLR